MFICNVKVNSKILFRILIILMVLIVLAIFVLSMQKLLGFHQEEVMNHSDITEIKPNDYTNILKAVHEDIKSYLGKEIKFSGYVYRVIDFSNKQFVLARDMLMDSQSYVVGFLCEYDKINDFEDGTWIEITGVITQGKYHNQNIPIIKVTNLKKIDIPSEPFVLPPSNTYIPTSAIL